MNSSQNESVHLLDKRSSFGGSSECLLKLCGHKFEVRPVFKNFSN